MKKFYVKLIVYIAVVGLPYVYFQYNLMAKNDAFYWKSTYSANTLIIGGSRAFKGIDPQIIKDSLNLKGKALNLAFTGVDSPYGRYYLNLIKRKIDYSDHSKYLFILSVNPGNVMDFADAKVDRESTFPFYDLYCVNCAPNIEYVFRHPRSGRDLLTTLIYDRDRYNEGRKIYKNGYAASFLPENYTPREKPKNQKLIKFNLVRSIERENYLDETVSYLSGLGNVYLVRIPTSKRMWKEEESVYPHFSSMVQRIADKYENAFYFNYSPEADSTEYLFSDGNQHLEGKSAILFTRNLATDIKQHQ